MKPRHIFLYGLLIISLLGPLDADSIDPVQWEADSLAKMEELGNLPPDEAIPQLGRWLLKLSLRTTTIEGKWKLHAVAQKKLLSIPGHAEWYRDDLLARYRKWEQTENPTMASYWNDFDRQRGWTFETLKEMPSVETVRVLGEMLGDEEDGYGTEAPPGANLDHWAAAALTVIGIESPPFPPPEFAWRWRRMSDSKLKAWRLWYGQVKAGNRTFRFEGDETEYTLEGPVRTATGATGRSGPGKPAPDSATPRSEEEKRGLPWLAAGLALVVLLIAGAAWLRTKQGRRTW